MSADQGGNQHAAKPAAAKRSVVVNIRVTPAEAETLGRLALKHDVSLSNLLRRIAIDIARFNTPTTERSTD